MVLSIYVFVTFPGIGIFITCSLLSLFSAPNLAASSAASFPSVPIWALTQASVHPFTLLFKFYSASAVLRAMDDLKSILFSDFSAACMYVCMYRGRPSWNYPWEGAIQLGQGEGPIGIVGPISQPRGTNGTASLTLERTSAP